MVFLHYIVFFCGSIAFISGLLFIFFPRALLKISGFFNNIFEMDTMALRYRVGMGLSLLFSSFFMFFMAYYFLVFKTKL
jgi:hypothetical protein